MNSKGEFNRCRITRLTLGEPQEKTLEEMGENSD